MENGPIQNYMIEEIKVMKMTMYWIPNFTVFHFYISLLKHAHD